MATGYSLLRDYNLYFALRTDRLLPNANELEFQWGCFLCNHPEKAVGFLHGTGQPMIEGQLKEKKGKWRLFRRWRTRYFTLSGAHLSCKGSVNSFFFLNNFCPSSTMPLCFSEWW